MATVTVRNKYEVVIPLALRQKLGISRGDILEAKVERGRLTFIPRNAIDRPPADRLERQRLLKQMRHEAPAWLKETWTASRRNGTDKMTMRQIDAEVAAVRRGHTRKSSNPVR